MPTVDEKLATLEARFIAHTTERLDALRANDKPRVKLCDIKIDFVLRARGALKRERPLIDA